MNDSLVVPKTSHCHVCPIREKCQQYSHKQFRPSARCLEGFIKGYTDPKRTMARIMSYGPYKYVLWLSYRTMHAWTSINHANGTPVYFKTAEEALRYLDGIFPNRKTDRL